VRMVQPFHGTLTGLARLVVWPFADRLGTSLALPRGPTPTCPELSPHDDEAATEPDAAF